MLISIFHKITNNGITNHRDGIHHFNIWPYSEAFTVWIEAKQIEVSQHNVFMGLFWQKLGVMVDDAQQWWWQFTSASQVPSWQHLQDSSLKWPSQWQHSPRLLQQVHTAYTKSKQRQGYQRKAKMDPDCYLHHFYWICISMLSFAESLYRFLQIHFQQHKHQIRSQFWPRQY